LNALAKVVVPDALVAAKAGELIVIGRSAGFSGSHFRIPVVGVE